MQKTTFKGISVELSGDFLEKGIAPDFDFVTADLSKNHLYGLGDQKKLILSAPSLDTGVCAMEAKKFNEKLSNYKEIAVLFITCDLPFAMNRFCKNENIAHLTTGSDFRYGDFGKKWGMRIANTALEGLLARAAWVLNEKNEIVFAELVAEVTSEPNYDTILQALKK